MWTSISPHFLPLPPPSLARSPDVYAARPRRSGSIWSARRPRWGIWRKQQRYFLVPMTNVLWFYYPASPAASDRDEYCPPTSFLKQPLPILASLPPAGANVAAFHRPCRSVQRPQGRSGDPCHMFPRIDPCVFSRCNYFTYIMSLKCVGPI